MKMNADQIVKALRCHAAGKCFRDCDACDNYPEDIYGQTKIMQHAADLIESLQAQLAQQQSNEPLTLEELRGMDGEPVWVAPKDECCPPHWRIWDNDEPCDTQVFDAYRYKPKEATHAEI